MLGDAGDGCRCGAPGARARVAKTAVGGLRCGAGFLRAAGRLALRATAAGGGVDAGVLGWRCTRASTGAGATTGAGAGTLRTAPAATPARGLEPP